MRGILNLFGRSPFAPLRMHMEKVRAAVKALPELFTALEAKEFAEVTRLNDWIGELEHEADIAKNDIRNHLPKSLFLAIDRSQLLEILALQDDIADRAEDVAVLSSLEPLELMPEFRQSFWDFLNKNLEAFDGVFDIILELHELLESSFGGVEAEKVRSMVHSVSKQEHEADLIQRTLLKHFCQAEDRLTFITYDRWQKIFACIGDISNFSEKLALRIRMTLEL